MNLNWNDELSEASGPRSGYNIRTRLEPLDTILQPKHKCQSSHRIIGNGSNTCHTSPTTRLLFDVSMVCVLRLMRNFITDFVCVCVRGERECVLRMRVRRVVVNSQQDTQNRCVSMARVLISCSRLWEYRTKYYAWELGQLMAVEWAWNVLGFLCCCLRNSTLFRNDGIFRGVPAQAEEFDCGKRPGILPLSSGQKLPRTYMFYANRALLCNLRRLYSFYSYSKRCYPIRTQSTL